jgi:hypothetical protein
METHNQDFSKILDSCIGIAKFGGLVPLSELQRRRAISGNQAKIIFSETNALGTF